MCVCVKTTPTKRAIPWKLMLGSEDSFSFKNGPLWCEIGTGFLNERIVHWVSQPGRAANFCPVPYMHKYTHIYIYMYTPESDRLVHLKIIPSKSKII